MGNRYRYRDLRSLARLREYKNQIRSWELIYGVKHNTFDLISFSLFCAKCGNTPAQRHHKGNDFFFAKISPDVYAKRYLEFHTDDIVPLCNNCHKKIHMMYEELLQPFYNLRVVKPKDIEKYKQKCIRRCESWLKRKIKIKENPKIK